ncbi:hypothetical protein [Fimbriimonas ginsengisoli]|uniref:Peptidase S9, prolyl oligopeptidase active site domain protein n=1 Tax=Fimbriimonas ginsengisoli Gsoil 348 TaxID=661478 RepID=A0A068NW47_FIMGI|nr:hypothetical protein [Fimbriimonas ginsengisoli]AIE87552.1 peptidase S9, prolyl oligopeptidase active site domain protein [Fimbriimonas ginsengisoli Gsoil 348]
MPLIALAVAVALAGAQAKPTLKPEDYRQWEGLGATQISDDGRWISYGISRVDADGNLVLKSSDGPQTALIPNGVAASFSDNSKWCGYLITPSKAATEKLRAEKKPVETKLGLRNLESGAERQIDSVRSYEFLKGSRFLVAQRYRGASKSEGGSDLTVVDLSDGRVLSVGNVSGYVANHDETLLALVVESDTGEKGVQLLDPAARSLTPLTWGRDTIANLDWAKNQDVLAFLVGSTDDKHEGASYRLVVGKDLRANHPTLRFFPTEGRIPANSRIAEVAPVAVSDDGNAVAFGVQEWRAKPKPPVKPEDKAGVEIWNTHDVRVMPRQKITSGGDRNRTSLCVWHLDDDTFRMVGDGAEQSATLLPDFQFAILNDPTPYLSPVTNGFDYRDAWLVNTRTGEKSRLLTKHHWPIVPSRTGHYLTYYDRRNWWLYDVRTGQKRNLTGDQKISFEDEESDYTVPEKSPAGFPTWLKNDEGVLLQDDFDVWLARPAGGF